MWYLITVIRKAKFASYDQLITGVCGILAFSNSLKWIVMKNYIRFAIWTDKIKFCWFFFFSKCSCFLCKCSCFLCKLVLFKVLALHAFVVFFVYIFTPFKVPVWFFNSSPEEVPKGSRSIPELSPLQPSSDLTYQLLPLRTWLSCRFPCTISRT